MYRVVSSLHLTEILSALPWPFTVPLLLTPRTGLNTFVSRLFSLQESLALLVPLANSDHPAGSDQMAPQAPRPVWNLQP